MKNAIHVLPSKASHRQMQSIIITTEGGKVIAIDGGRREDTDYFIEYLKEITGQEIPVIDAWFLTHAHNDHLPVFLKQFRTDRARSLSVLSFIICLLFSTIPVFPVKKITTEL